MVIGFILDDNLDVADGVQQAVLNNGATLSKMGHEVHYLVCETERHDVPNIHSLARSLKMKFNGNSVRTPIRKHRKEINTLLNEINFDVLHVQSPFSPVFAGYVIRQAHKRGIPVVSTFHILPYGFVSRVGMRLLRAVFRPYFSKISASVAVSQPAADFMEQSLKVTSTVVPNPVDHTFFNSVKRTKASDKIELVYVGRFDERKGVKQLAQAISNLDSEVLESIHVTMCGKGPLHQEVSDYIQANNLPVDLPGFVSDEEKAQYLSNADIAVFPSISGESFGIVLTESMSSNGYVTLGGNNPGYSSVLHEWPETLFDPTDMNEFVTTLEKYITDERLREEVAKKQKKRAKDYDNDVVAQQLLKIYRDSRS